MPADLETIQHALRLAWRDHSFRLPLAAGTPVRLIARSKGDRDWVVADVLMAELMELGHPVRLDSGNPDTDSGATLTYRIVDARVVYTPAGGGWRFWRRGATRHALADVLLHLEDGDGELNEEERRKAREAMRERRGGERGERGGGRGGRGGGEGGEGGGEGR